MGEHETGYTGLPHIPQLLVVLGSAYLIELSRLLRYYYYNSVFSDDCG